MPDAEDTTAAVPGDVILPRRPNAGLLPNRLMAYFLVIPDDWQHARRDTIDPHTMHIADPAGMPAIWVEGFGWLEVD